MYPSYSTCDAVTCRNAKPCFRVAAPAPGCEGVFPAKRQVAKAGAVYYRHFVPGFRDLPSNGRFRIVPGPSSLLPTTPAGGHALSRDPAKSIYKPRSRPMLTRIAPAPQVCSPLCRLGGHVLFGNPANRIHRARFSARPYARLHRIALCGCIPRDGVVPNPAKRIHRAQSGARARDCVYQIGLCGCKS